MTQLRRKLLSLAVAGTGLYLAARGIRKARNSYDFRGRSVLITGGSRGLGLLMARQLAAEGAKLLLVARDSLELERAARELREQGADVSVACCDMASREEVDSLTHNLLADGELPDVLINNAGIISMAPVEATNFEDYDVAMRTHFFGPLTLIQGLLPALRRRGEGRIVNIGSIGGLISVPHLLPYCTSKFALVGYSQGLHHELAKDGIIVTTICPGLMLTGSPRKAVFKGDHCSEYAWFKISGSLPVVSMNAERAARQIVSACREGLPMAVLGAPASIVAKLAGLWPNVMAHLLATANSLLPRWDQGPTSRKFRGAESETAISKGWWTSLTDKAAERNNEN